MMMVMSQITDHEKKTIPESYKSEILERTMKDKEDGYQQHIEPGS